MNPFIVRGSWMWI